MGRFLQKYGLLSLVLMLFAAGPALADGSYVISVDFIPDTIGGHIGLDIATSPDVYGYDVYTDSGTKFQASVGYPVGPGTQTVNCNNQITGTHAFTLILFDSNYAELGSVEIGSYTDNNIAQPGYVGGGGGGGGGGVAIANVQRVAGICDQLEIEYYVNEQIDFVDWVVIDTSNETEAADQPDLTVPPGAGTYTTVMLFGGLVYTLPNGNYRLEATPYDGDGLAGSTESFLFSVSCAVVDTDGDGMPDDWEDQHACVDSAVDDDDADPDGDGATNVEEFEAGTDPCDAEDTPPEQPPELPDPEQWDFQVPPPFVPMMELFFNGVQTSPEFDAMSSPNFPQVGEGNLNLTFDFNSGALQQWGSYSWTTGTQDSLASSALESARVLVRALLAFGMAVYGLTQTWARLNEAG